MSILQLEVSEKTRQLLEAQAQQEGIDAQNWAAELFEEAVRARHREQEMRRQQVEKHLLEALESGEGQVVDAAWWKQLEEETLAQLEAQDKS